MDKFIVWCWHFGSYWYVPLVIAVIVFFVAKWSLSHDAENPDIGEDECSHRSGILGITVLLALVIFVLCLLGLLIGYFGS